MDGRFGEDMDVSYKSKYAWNKLSPMFHLWQNPSQAVHDWTNCE